MPLKPKGRSGGEGWASALELRRLIRSFYVLKSHGRLCHRQDNTAAILRGRWGRRHGTAHEAADTAHQGAKAGLDEAAAEEGEECAECSVGEEGEGEGEEM